MLDMRGGAACNRFTGTVLNTQASNISLTTHVHLAAYALDTVVVEFAVAA